MLRPRLPRRVWLIHMQQDRYRAYAGNGRNHRPLPDAFGTHRGRSERHPGIHASHGLPDKESIPTCPFSLMRKIRRCVRITVWKNKTAFHYFLGWLICILAHHQVMLASQSIPQVESQHFGSNIFADQWVAAY